MPSTFTGLCLACAGIISYSSKTAAKQTELFGFSRNCSSQSLNLANCAHFCSIIFFCFLRLIFRGLLVVGGLTQTFFIRQDFFLAADFRRQSSIDPSSPKLRRPSLIDDYPSCPTSINSLPNLFDAALQLPFPPNFNRFLECDSIERHRRVL